MSTHVVPPHRDWFVGHMFAHNGVPSVWHPNMQEVMVPGTQAPAPSQSAAVVAVEEVQLAAAPHEVVLGG